MPNGTYGGVRGRKTKVGRKLLRFPPTRLCLSESSFDRYAGRECIAFGVRDSDDVISGCRGECHLMQISCFSDVTVVQMPVYRGVVIAVGEAADYAFATAAELERDSDCAA